MPAYVYKCCDCQHEFETVHSITEELHDCESCEAKGTLKRVPQLLTSYAKQKTERDLAGERVKRAIEDNRQILLDQKESLKRER